MARIPPAEEQPGTSSRSRRRRTRSGVRTLLAAAALLMLPPAAAHAQSLDRLTERLDRLERENRELRKEIEAIEAAQARRPPPPPAAAAPASSKAPAGFVRTDPEFAYEILDPTDSINRKERLLLDRKRDGTLAPGGLYLQGAITPIANYQSSNRADKFGYLIPAVMVQNPWPIFWSRLRRCAPAEIRVCSRLRSIDRGYRRSFGRHGLRASCRA